MLSNPKYQVILFKDKVKKKIIKKFNNFKNAEKFFLSLIDESQSVVFPKIIEGTKECKFELAILEKGLNPEIPQYTTDEYGRNIKVQLLDDEWGIIKINLYNQEEKVFDIQQSKKIDVKELIRKYLRGDGLKMINSLNNKLIIQKDDEFKIFSLKSNSEVTRLLDCLTHYFIKQKRTDCLIVKDTSVAQKKYLLKYLEENGFDKKLFYRQYTTYPR